MNRFRNDLYLGAALCSIIADGQGNVTGGGGPLSVTGQGEVTTGPGAPLRASVSEALKDPAETPVAAATTEETPEAKTARETEEARRAALTDEQRAAEDAEKAKQADPWENRDKTKDVALTTEETTAINSRTDLNDAQKAVMVDSTVEMKTTGDLSPASVTKAAKAWGVSEDMVRTYVNGLKPAYAADKAAREAGTAEKPAATTEAAKAPEMPAQQVKDTLAAITQVTGSQANYTAFTEWANTNLSDAEANDLVASIGQSPQAAARAVREYYGRYTAQGGNKGPADLSRGSGNGGNNPPPAQQGYTSRDEQNQALRARDSMGRLRMEVDPNYRQQVETKMALSNFSSNVTGSIMGAFRA